MNGKEVRVGVSLLVGNMDNMVRFYRDILGFQTQWNGGSFADFETASGELSLFMYSREEFVKAIGEDYIPPNGINQTFEIALWLPSFAVKRDNISYNISLPVRRAIFLQVLKKPYFLGLSAHFPFLGFGNKARIFAGTFQS